MVRNVIGVVVLLMAIGAISSALKPKDAKNDPPPLVVAGPAEAAPVAAKKPAARPPAKVAEKAEPTPVAFTFGGLKIGPSMNSATSGKPGLRSPSRPLNLMAGTCR